MPLATTHIVHTGTGDSFRVDDESNDTTPFVITESGNIGIGTTNPQAKLHVHGSDVVTTNARIERDIVDSSGNYPLVSTVNKVGTNVIVAPVDVSPGNNEGAITFPGTAGSWLAFPTGTAANINQILSADFTIEAWVYLNSYQGEWGIIGQISGGSFRWSFAHRPTGVMDFHWLTTTDQIVGTASVIPLKKWTHIAVQFTFSNKNLQIFINGVAQTLSIKAGTGATVSGTIATITNTSINVQTWDVIVGQYSATQIDGYISNLRFVHGAGNNPWVAPSLALPLANVTGTKLLLRVGQGNQNYGPVVRPPLFSMGGYTSSFYDASGNYDQVAQTMVTGSVVGSTFSPGGSEGSLYFPGTGNYISCLGAAAINNIFTADFLIEAWVNYLATPPVNAFSYIPTLVSYGSPTSSPNFNYWNFGVDANLKVGFYWYTTAGNAVYTSSAILLNTWAHIAVSFNFTSKELRLYINGAAAILTNNGTTSFILSSPSVSTANAVYPLVINGQNSVGGNVYVSNLRFIHGSTQAPSLTLPLTSTANTKLLLRANSTSTLAPMYPPIGNAPLYACRAWINFDGFSLTIRGSGNVSSLVRNATGDYTIFFTNAMSNANYSVVATSKQINWAWAGLHSSSLPTTTSVRVVNQTTNSNVYNNTDCICIIVVG